VILMASAGEYALAEGVGFELPGGLRSLVFRYSGLLSFSQVTRGFNRSRVISRFGSSTEVCDHACDHDLPAHSKRERSR
jgi:hypothetical protein